MYTILIVEDEVFVRMGIASALDWEANGFAQPIQAGNGREAWDIIQSQEIHLVMTDIMMPEMDGLQLIQKMRENDYNQPVIILSCLNDFESAQKALRLGAMDYLFKPTLLPCHILDAIIKVVLELENKNSSKKNLQDLERQVGYQLPKIKHQVILDQILGRVIKRQEWQNLAKSYQINLNLNQVVLVMLKMDSIGTVLEQTFKGDEFILQFSVQNILNEMLIAYEPYEIICKQTDEYLIITSLEKIPAFAEMDIEYILPLRAILKSLKNILKLNANIGISHFYHRIETLKSAYEDATYAIEKGRLLGESDQIVCFDAINPNQSGDRITLLKQRNRNDIQVAINYMKKHLGEEHMSLESVADSVHMSKNYFSKLFKDTMEVNFIDYLTQLRVEKAKVLYATSNMKIYEIAEAVGYSDWRYFGKVYKKLTGVTLSGSR